MEYPKDYINKIICGDCLEVMKGIPDKSIDMVLTSPPYDNLRDYKGYTFNFEGIAKELFRIVKDGGVCVWVVGDATIDGSETGTSFKQALYFKDIGFKLHDTMIYIKNQTPFPATNRYNQQFEFMFVLLKGKLKTFNPFKRKNTFVYNKTKLSSQRGADGKTTKFETEFNDESIDNNYWFFDTGYMLSSKDKNTFKHPANLPEALASKHIQSWSNKDDIVLDCFNGSGTTTKQAKLLGRR